MRLIGSLLGLVACGGAVLLAAVRTGEAADAEGVGCPVVSGSVKSNPQRIRRGKVLGLELLLDRIEDWGDAEEIHVGFELPHEDHEDHEDHDHRELKTFKAKKTKAQAAQVKAVKAKGKNAQPKAKATPPRAKAAAGGEEEHEHAPFMYRNGNIKPKLFPKTRENWPHYEHHDGLVEWDLEKDMAYSAPAYRFLIFGKVEKEWEEDHMNFHAFVHNATGFTCWEEEISVPVF